MSKDRKRKRGKRRRRRPRRGSDRRQPPETIDEAERRLQDEIQGFAHQGRFREDFERGLARYFGQEVLESRTLSIDETELPGFQEWYFFDYVTSSGETIIDSFARKVGPRLSKMEQELLEKWRQWNRYRLFEVQKVMPGTGVLVEDLLSGETLEVHDRSASRSLTRWQIFLARPLYTDRLHFTGAGIPLPPARKEAVLAYSRQLLADFKAQHPDATLDEFYQQHGVDIYHAMRRIATERPVVITSEGHEIEPSTAYYDVADSEAVFEQLEQTEEFHYAGPSAEDADALHFNWLLRGRSHVPEQPKPESEALELQAAQWTPGPGGPRYRSLGDVTSWQNRLELSCMSRARLEAGKELLETVLGRLIRHRRDKTESMDDFLASEPEEPPVRETIPPAEAEALVKEIFEEQYKQWVDKPIPALGGKTPREAVRDPEGRAQVVEILKSIEYTEEKRREAGEPWFDVNQIRRDLDLPLS
ncbi:MAG: hypothetical protein MAG451_03132 [Anaerolineales bacterium]|nr:hypothetical protein [Anaerolineales bacterium]